MAGKLGITEMRVRASGTVMLMEKREIKRENKSTLYLVELGYMGSSLTVFLPEDQHRQLVEGHFYSFKADLADTGNGLRLNKPTFEKIEGIA